MDKLPSNFSILLGQITYHCRLLLRMPRGIFSAFLVPVLVLLALHFVSGISHISRANLYLITGPITMGVVMTAYDSHALGLLTARTSGILKRMHGTPLPSWCYFVGRIIATIIVCIVSSIAVLIVARTLYKFNLNLGIILQIAFAVALGALAWATIGTAITRLIHDAKSGQTILSAIYLPLLFVSGTFSSFASEPKWVQTLAKFFPARPISQGIEHILSNSGFNLISLSDYAVLIAWALLGMIVSILSFRWE